MFWSLKIFESYLVFYSLEYGFLVDSSKWKFGSLVIKYIYILVLGCNYLGELVHVIFVKLGAQTDKISLPTIEDEKLEIMVIVLLSLEEKWCLWVVFVCWKSK